MACYEEFIKNIGITLNFRINKENKKLEYRDLTRPEKLKLFQNINIPMLLPRCSQNTDIQVIWAKFMDMIGDLKLEKYNDRASKDFFRSTNHKGVDALKQLFLKKNRIQFLEAAGYERVKNTYKCNNCSNKGHNIKTCTSSCKNCPAPICCAHLVKEGGKWIPRCQLQY